MADGQEEVRRVSAMFTSKISTLTATEPSWPNTSCCFPDYPGGCVCPPMERALRAWKAGRIAEPMNAGQREACLAEVEKVEGHARAEHAHDSDADLALAVITAWVDYARDKGLM